MVNALGGVSHRPLGRPDRQRGMEAGGCAFLTKPYQVEELQAAVAEAVTGHEKRKIHIAISVRQSACGKRRKQ